jgi:NADPH-dependent 2,4-dienoyl-CoA reductase/sulfur reductase-like enzyme/rhodanese-related sulfurtransferase
MNINRQNGTNNQTRRNPMKIVIVGGVAAGMSAAARARRLDERAEIVVLEKDRYVSFANCGLPYHIGGAIQDRHELLIVTPEDLKVRLNLDVRTEHEVVRIDREGKRVLVRPRRDGHEYWESYDKLVLTPGARPIRPPIPGIDHPQIYTLRNIPDMDVIKAEVDSSAKSAVVIGGGYIGVEMAEALRERGLRVALVELEDSIMPTLDHEMDRALIYHLESYGVQMHLGSAATAFHDVAGRVQVELENGTRFISDMVILAIGVRPASELAQEAGLELGVRGSIRVDAHMRTSDPDIYAAGDAVEVTHTVTGEPSVVALAGPANRQGRLVADHICGRDGAYSTTQGTSVVKVFDMTAGGTGATEATLHRLGIAHEKLYIHPNGHAGYYPGTHPMHLKVLFSPEDGRILGAQGVGFDGVDKRIDVFATAIRAGMTVHDLEHLELAYAPPYGSAKDPVNMAGFVACNVLDGTLGQWYAEDYPEVLADGLVVDVRPPSAFRLWHIPGAINIPLTEIRDRLEELAERADGRPVYLYCRVGFTSYIALRVMVQSGFKQVYSLSGGVQTFILYHRNQLATGRPGVPFVPYAEHKMAKVHGGLVNP